jgi:hypothetical protein
LPWPERSCSARTDGWRELAPRLSRPAGLSRWCCRSVAARSRSAASFRSSR